MTSDAGLHRKPLTAFSDIHTHNPEPCPDRIISISPGQPMHPDGFYSIGIHPWDTPADPTLLRTLRDTALADSRVVAIGECGLDKHRGAPLDEQEKNFESQIEIAEELSLPLIIHCVGALDRLLRLRKKHPRGQWVLHGFRAAPPTAQQLLKADISLSFGTKFNPESFLITPPSRRFLESD